MRNDEFYRVISSADVGDLISYKIPYIDETTNGKLGIYKNVILVLRKPSPFVHSKRFKTHYFKLEAIPIDEISCGLNKREMVLYNEGEFKLIKCQKNKK